MKPAGVRLSSAEAKVRANRVPVFSMKVVEPYFLLYSACNLQVDKEAQRRLHVRSSIDKCQSKFSLNSRSIRAIPNKKMSI